MPDASCRRGRKDLTALGFDGRVSAIREAYRPIAESSKNPVFSPAPLIEQGESLLSVAAGIGSCVGALRPRRPAARMRSLKPTRFWATVAAAVALSGGCRYTTKDVDAWKGTVKGPGRMVAVVLADKYDLPLRTYAALSLVDMERGDVDGVAELQRTLERLDAGTRTQVIEGLVPGLTKLMQADQAQSSADRGPPPRQIRAKDAAFALLGQAQGPTHQALSDAVVHWYTVDFNGRSLAGGYSAEQVMRAVGSAGASVLVNALHARLPQQAVVKIAELIGQLGDDAAKAQAGDKLVRIEAEMRGPEFLAWLEQEITGTLAQGGEKPDAARVQKAAALNRDNFIGDGVLPAMKHLADQPKVAERLLQLAATPEPALADQRTRALQALEGKVRDEHLDRLLALALDATAPTSVRDYAFDRVGDTRSPRAVAPMWALVASPTDQRLRWRAGELVLAIGGGAVLEEFFLKLPGGEAAYEPEELDGYAGRMGQMTPLPVAAAAARLGSPNWWDRVIALKFFQRKGGPADVARLERLVADSALVRGKGWGSGTTVGKVAQEAIAGLRERVGNGVPPAAKPNGR
jgi:hypothetical protein